MSLPIEQLASIASSMIASDLTPPRDAMLITPLPAAMVRLQRLHAAAGHLAAEARKLLPTPMLRVGLSRR